MCLDVDRPTGWMPPQRRIQERKLGEDFQRALKSFQNINNTVPLPTAHPQIAHCVLLHSSDTEINRLLFRVLVALLVFFPI
jgi:hypothetical protein